MVIAQAFDRQMIRSRDYHMYLGINATCLFGGIFGEAEESVHERAIIVSGRA